MLVRNRVPGKPRVLFVTYHFPPSAASGVHRILGFSEHLPTFGWHVTVVAPPTIPWEPVDAKLIAKIPVGTRVINVDYPTEKTYLPIRKIHGYAAWLPRALKQLTRIMSEVRPDLVVTSGPPHCVHLTGLYLKRKYSVKWLADFRDPWRAGVFTAQKEWWWIPLAEIGERWVFGRADGIVVNAPNAAKAVISQYPRHATKVHCVTNGYDPTRFSGLARKTSGKFLITHTGELYAGRDPRAFLDAVRNLLAERPAESNRIAIEFIGSTASAGFDLSHEIASRGLDKIASIVGHVPYARSLERMVNSDLLLLVDSPNRTLGVPAKLYEYIGANKPILALASTDSDVEWALGESGRRYRLVRPNDVQGIQNALYDLISDGGRAETVSADCDRFSRLSVTQELSDVMTSLIRDESSNRHSLPINGVDSCAGLAAH